MPNAVTNLRILPTSRRVRPSIEGGRRVGGRISPRHGPTSTGGQSRVALNEETERGLGTGQQDFEETGACRGAGGVAIGA